MAEMLSHGGILIFFDHYIRMPDGRIERTRDQAAWRGSVEQFKAKNPNVAIVGYHEINEDGEVGETCVMLNEKLPPLPKPEDNPNNGAITPEVMQKAIENINKPSVPTMPSPAAEQASAQMQERVVKDGDSYIKIVGNKIYKLDWIDYDESKAEFDKKVRVTEDGKIQITQWRELNG